MGVDEPSKMSQSDRKSYSLFVWHRFISFRNGVVKYEKEHSVMYQGPTKIGANYITKKGCEIILENAYFFRSWVLSTSIWFTKAHC